MYYSPYIIRNELIEKSMKQDMEFGNPYAYADEKNIIYVVTDSEFECVYLAKNGHAVSGDIMKYLHVATRKEIQEAGLWNMVINKDNYSSEQDEIETKLDEYQKLGEEILGLLRNDFLALSSL